MNIQEIERLRYRRQYVLSPVEIDCPFVNRVRRLNDHAFLYTHVDLLVTTESSDTRKLVLLGDMFDYENPEWGNSEILQDLIRIDFNLLLAALAKYSGRFVLIMVENKSISMMHDAAAARKVYYYRNGSGLWCASQPYLLGRILKLDYTSDPSKLKFYKSPFFTRLYGANLNNMTWFDGMLQLPPNHYLDVQTFSIIRYWPDQVIEEWPFDTVVDHTVRMIKGYMDSILNRYEVMLPVTAGKDSRILMSATRGRSDRVYYYLNKEKWLNEKSQDVHIPQTLFPKLGLTHHLIDPYIPIDEDFKKVYFENNPFACALYLPVIYNYYLNFGNRVNLPGTFINLVEDLFDPNGNEITGEMLAGFIHIDQYDFAVRYLDNWYERCRDLCARNKLNIINLFYWEERMANWGTQIQLDKDIAQEDFIPYNSRLLIQTMLRAEPSTRQKPLFLFHRAIIGKLWPEALQMPFSTTPTRRLLSLTHSLGLMKPAKALYYSSWFQPVRNLNNALRHYKLNKEPELNP